MIAILTLLVVLAISLLVTRVASVALVHTGMGREAARFQARSAFTGVGFTTQEAESVASHPVRRRIVSTLMVAGSAGIVTVIASVLLSMLDLRRGETHWSGLGVLAGGLLVLWWLACSAWVDRHVCRLISWTLRRFTNLDLRDYARILHLREAYGVSELRIAEGDWLAGRRIGEVGIVREGVLVLGIECPGGRFLGAPGPETELRAGDLLILYGQTPRIAELDRRRGDAAGLRAHTEAVSERQRVEREERRASGR